MFIVCVQIQLPIQYVIHIIYLIENYNTNVIKSESMITTSRKNSIYYSKIIVFTISYIVYPREYHSNHLVGNYLIILYNLYSIHLSTNYCCKLKNKQNCATRQNYFLIMIKFQQLKLYHYININKSDKYSVGFCSWNCFCLYLFQLFIKYINILLNISVYRYKYLFYCLFHHSMYKENINHINI